jgi:proline dehydrogenase
MNPLDTLVVKILPLVPSRLVRAVASRYVAGETLEDAVRTVRQLNAEGCVTTLDVLGEDVTRISETERTVAEYRRALDAIAEHRLDSNISVKLTALGLKLDARRCREHFGTILEAARAHGNSVRIDMEDSSVTEETIRIYLESRKLTDQVGLVLQSYLRRSREDARRVIAVRANVRVCKGIYVEPPEIAYQGREEIRDNFAALVDDLLEAGCYTGIATHDEALVTRALATIRRLGVSRDGYEFQVLLGVAGHLRRGLVSSGHRLRVYVPYGESWRAYSLRRLKENPAIAGHILRGLLSGGR